MRKGRDGKESSPSTWPNARSMDTLRTTRTDSEHSYNAHTRNANTKYSSHTKNICDSPTREHPAIHSTNSTPLVHARAKLTASFNLYTKLYETEPIMAPVNLTNTPRAARILAAGPSRKRGWEGVRRDSKPPRKWCLTESWRGGGKTNVQSPIHL